jgi:uncharacterized protein (TIRG00374 family)
MGLVFLSILMIVTMILMANPRDLVSALGGVNLFLVFIVIVLYFINLFVKALRWHILVNSTEDSKKVPFKRILPYYLIGLALNNVTPGRIGGDPVRAYILKSKEKVPLGQGLSSVFIEKIADLFILAILALIGVLLLFPYLQGSIVFQLLLGVIIVFVGIFAVLYAVLRTTLLEKFTDSFLRITNKMKRKDADSEAGVAVKSIVTKFREGVEEIMNRKKGLGITISLTVAVWLNEAVRLYIILMALGINNLPSLAMVIIVSSMATLFGSILIWGTGNAAIIAGVFATVGLSLSNATAAGFLMIMTSIWLSVPIGVGIMLITTGRLITSSKESKKVESEPAEKKKEYHKMGEPLKFNLR